MKTQMLRLLCPLGALIGFPYLGNAVYAQGSLNGSSSSRSGSSIPKETSTGTAEKNALKNDSRLRFKVSIERKATTIEQALSKLSEYTPVSLVAEGAEVRSALIFFHYNATPLRDILASIADTGNWEWTWRTDNMLVLRAHYDPHALDVHRPRNEAQKEVYQRGKEFLDQFGKLPPNIQDALYFNNETQESGSHPGLPFNTLPSSLQETLRAMLSAHTKSMASEGGSSLLTSDNLSQSMVRLQPGRQQEGFDHFNVDLAADLPGGVRASIGMTFVVFHDPRDGYNVVPGDELAPVERNIARQDALSRQQALTNNPRLQDKISLKMANASLFQALQVLSAKADFAFAAQHQLDKGKTMQKSFSFPPMALGEMLDQLTALYNFSYGGKRCIYTWGQQADKVFVFHIAPERSHAGE